MAQKKLRIAMLGHKRIPSREGGIEVVVEELSTRMVAKGYNVVCYNRKGHHVAGEEFDNDKINTFKGVILKDVPTIDKRGLAAITSSTFASVKATFGRYDIVHIHAEGPAFMCWLPRLFGKRVIVTVHGLDHQRAKWGKFASMYIMMGERNAVRFANEIIVLSSGVQNYFMQKYQRKTKFIPNGVNEPKMRPIEKIQVVWGLEKDKYILYLGRIVPEKGERYLIEAFKQVKTEMRLVIAGGNSDTDAFMNELKEMAKGDNRIMFTGFVQGRIKHELYTNPYIYVLPSDLEGMPLSLLEGMSYGNCCVCSDIPECTEVVENMAVIFKKGDVNDLRDKLQILCEHPEIVEKYKKSAHDFVISKYGWNDVVERTLELYRS